MKDFFCRLFTPWKAGAQFDAPEAFYGFLLGRDKLLGTIRNLCFAAALVLLVIGYAVSDGTGGYSIADIANQPYYLIAVGVMVLALLCAVLERALRRRAGADASLLWIPERLRPMLHRSGGFLRRTRRLWLVWLAWAVLLAGLWFLADGQLDRVLAPWIARYGEELVQSGFPESWTILRGRLEADVALWLRLRQGVLIAGAVSGAGVLVWTLLHWKKRRPPLAEEGET